MAFLKLELPSRFEVVRRIGAGGMGVVYEVIDLERGERLALKTILHHDADTVARVKHEFRALADIHHPNLVALRELVADADDVFFTMELVEGVDLLRWVRGEPRRARNSSAPTAKNLSSGSAAAPVSGTRPSPEPLRESQRPATSGVDFDEARLRDSFRQVAIGLSALHAAGKVHRDVKPSNVRVTREGRVVLLDFGLVFEVSARQLTEHGAVGTPAYMAPEQALAEGVEPSADWYAVGVMLYECLTGHRPFEGAADLVLASKRFHEAEAPSSIVAGVPRDLEELCMELLHSKPAMRPSGDDVLRRLSARQSRRPAVAGAPFVGRDDELEMLTKAFAEVPTRGALTVVLYGESGVGKSSLVRRFLDVATSGPGEALVLSGRCYEREAVPYKALDEIIEMLSRRLARMSREEIEGFLPPDARVLALLFPAMARVPALEASSSIPDVDPLERRRGAFRALCNLLRALSAKHRLVLTIDDLQWTDAESLQLLQEILRPPNAPPVLLVVTMRQTQQSHDAATPPPLVASLAGEVRAARVGRLAREHAQELAEALLEHTAGTAARDAVAIALEAGGHPLFIDELVRHAALAGSARVGSLRLDDALLHRADQLDPAARTVLEATCVLGAPATQDVIAHAARLDMSDLARAVSLLRATHFIRTDGARLTDAIEPFHDRVREAVVARLDAPAKRSWSARIAEALEHAKTSDPEVLATHWSGAGEAAKAATYTRLAAEQAAHALAFRRSARLFERCLELLPEGDPERRGVHEKLAGALANAGECGLAAAAYEGAAAGAAPSDAIDLRRRAAEQLLKAGEADRGLVVARSVLADVDLRLPNAMLPALLTLLWLRFVLWMRGTRFTLRAPKDVAPSELTRIDVCWSVSFTLPYDDPLAAGVCHARHVLLALAVGDPVRTARALAMEAAYTSAVAFDGWPRAEAMLAVARRTADESGDPYAKAIVMGLGGIAAFSAARFQQSIAELTQAVARFREQVPGSAFEAANATFFLFAAMGYAGQYGELRPLLERALEDAGERGDRYAAVMLRIGIVNSAWLFAGEPERARRELAEARRVMPADRFRAVHHQALLAECYADLFDGTPEHGYARFHEALPAIRRAFLMHMAGYRSELAAARSRLALGCAARTSGDRREALIREAAQEIPALAAVPGPLGRANVRLVRANTAFARGRRDEALSIVESMAAEEAGDGWLARVSAQLVLARARNDEDRTRAVESEIRSRGGAITPGLLRITFPAFLG